MSDRSTSFKDYGSTATYRGEVERSFDFMPGMKHDTPIKAKAQALLDLVERRLGDPAQLTFLDVGCGTGSMQRYVLPRVGRSIGVDMEAAQKLAAVPMPELDPPVPITGRPSPVASRGSRRGSYGFIP